MKKFKPTTSSLRFTHISDFSELTKKKPYKPLLSSLRKKGGRNSQGRITVRHRGGGHRRRYRMIDFKRDKFDILAKVESIEYDPNRSARIALLLYRDGERKYIIAPDGLRKGDVVQSGPGSPIKIGNTLPLSEIPIGMPIFNIELQRGKGGQLVRGAGTGAQILAKEGKFAHIKLPSGEIRLIHLQCLATIGQVSNIEHDTISYGKAGRRRWLGFRPRTRAVAMNPVDHPMGGGEGKASGGRHPCSPDGLLAKGLRTRKKRQSDKYIVKRRK